MPRARLRAADGTEREWRKVKADCDAWCRRDFAGEDIVRLILDGTVAKVRLDRKAASLSPLVVLGIRHGGHRRDCWRRAAWGRER